MKQIRDMTGPQFEDAPKRHGFEPVGFMGYCKVLEGPAAGICISAYNAGTRRRNQLRYLIIEKKKLEKRKQRLT